MKILFFHRWVGVHGGGTETHLLELATRFAKMGHEVSILTRQGQRLQNLDKAIKIYRVSKNRGEFDHSFTDLRLYWHTTLFMLKSFFKLCFLQFIGRKFDLISVHFATESIVAKTFRFFTHMPYIFILEGYTPWEAKEAKKANQSIAISSYEANCCQKEFDFKPKAIHIGVEKNRFNPFGEKWKKNLLGKDDEKIVLSVCRLEPRKDLNTMLDAAKILQNYKIRFVFAGTGIDEAKLKARSKVLGLKNVYFLGFVKDQDLPALYRSADLFILPTKEEGFGIVLVEAMASGIPIISNNVGAVPEVVGDSAALIPPKNAKLLADKICQILENDNMRKEMIEKGKKLADQNYNWSILIKQYETSYIQAINKHGNAKFKQ